jgi:hypothetical protein
MSEELKPLDISRVPELRRIVEEMVAAGSACELMIDQKAVAGLLPSEGSETNPLSRPTSSDDSLWNIVGLVSGNGPGDVSENIDAYLAQAYAAHEE